MSNSQPQYTVLRIKRKAGDAPLSQLLISGEPAAPERARKRRDISSRPRGVFRLAETVPPTWHGDGEEGEVLKNRIEGLLAQSPSPAPTPPTTADVVSPQPVQGGAIADGAVTVPAAQQPTSTSPIAPSSASPTSSLRPATQYRVVPRAIPKQDRNLPPRVITLAELEAARSALVFIDAQAVDSTGGTPSGLGAEPEDKEMAAFQSMLSEYLKLESQGATQRPTPRPADGADEPEEGDGEYVYDLYYRDLRDDGTGVDAGGEGIGALLGYDDLSPPSTPPDSEPEDEADEDSNDEDYYRNDYPEDEDADEDMEGYADAYSDGEWSRDEEEDDDERDPWDDYR